MPSTRSTNRYSALQSLIADQDTEIEDELAKGESTPSELLEVSLLSIESRVILVSASIAKTPSSHLEQPRND